MLISSTIKEFRLLKRDLHGVAVLFIMPILFMLIMSAALSSNNELNNKSEIILLGENNNLNKNLLDLLNKEKIKIKFVLLEELNNYRKKLQHGKFDLLIINENTDNTTLNEDKNLQLWLNPSIDRAWLLGVKGILQKHYSQLRINTYLNKNHIILEGNKRKQIKEIQNKVNKQLDEKFNQINLYLKNETLQEFYINRQGSEVNKPNSVQHSVPAWLIFGMFFIMIPLSNVMAMERQTNTITRLRIARASSFSLIMAKLIPYFFINQLQFIGMIALGYFVLPALDMPTFSLTGSYYAYAVLSCTISLAALGYGLLISVIAKTTEQAVVLGGGGIIIMAAIGGIMVPTYVMPEIMQTIAQFSPMGWALTGFQNLLLNQYDLSQIQQPLYLLSGFGIITLLLAMLIYRRQLHTQTRF